MTREPLTARAATVCLGLMLAAALPASAQYGAPGLYRGSDPDAETYRVEAAFGFWSPERSIIVQSESLGIIGTKIDAVEDLGFEKETFPEFRFRLKPGRKHKFRIDYMPIKYTGDAILTREIVFNGIKYTVGLPVQSQLDWRAWRFGYEYDFIARSWGYIGVIFEAKYTNVDVELVSPIDAEFAQAKAPVPAIGAVARVYPARFLSFTGEWTGIDLPEGDDYGGKYFDLDLYGTVNFNKNIGIQAGYRDIDVEYRIDFDSGDLELNGFYLQGVVRF